MDIAGASAVRFELDQEQASKRFYDVVWPERAAVLRAARMLVRNISDAEDVAQETLMKAFRKIESVPEGRVRAWLLTVLRNSWIDRYRSETAGRGTTSLTDLTAEPVARDDREVAADLSGTDAPADVLEGFSDQEVIDALHRLPDDIRWTLLLVDVEGWSQADAAESLKTPVGTIKSRVHRGHLMLRDELLPIARDRRVVRD